MKHAGGPQRADHVELGSADYVEVALDASCAALMALDLVRTFAADNERVTGRVSLAIAALRHAIADLREEQARDGTGREDEVDRPARSQAMP